MKTLILSANELSEIINNNTFIGRGSYGLVVKFDDEYLLKFNYKDFIEAFKIKDNMITLLTQGLVFVDDFCVGYMLKYHKDMISLYNFVQNSKISIDEKEYILNEIRVRMNELLKNNIYLGDFTTHNILINPTTKQIEIIDFEDSLICTTERDLSREAMVLDKFGKIEEFLGIDNQDEIIP